MRFFHFYAFAFPGLVIYTAEQSYELITVISPNPNQSHNHKHGLKSYYRLFLLDNKSKNSRIQTHFVDTCSTKKRRKTRRKSLEMHFSHLKPTKIIDNIFASLNFQH